VGRAGCAQALDCRRDAATGGWTPELQRIENTERAIGRLIDRLGGPEGLTVAYEAGPCGYALLRLLAGSG
jgi:hypothetical protein